MDIKSYPLLLLGEEWQIDNALKSYQGPLRELIHTFTYSAFNDLKIKNQLIEKCDFIILFYNEALSAVFFDIIQEVKHKTEFILIVEEDNFDFKKIINEWSIVKIVNFSDFNTAAWSGNIEILNKIEKKKERKAIIKKTTEQKTLTKSLQKEIADTVYLTNKDFYDAATLATISHSAILANTVWLHACQPNQMSHENAFNGLLTSAIKHLWRGGTFLGNFQQFVEDVTMLLPPFQSPGFEVLGGNPSAILQKRPFSI